VVRVGLPFHKALLSVRTTVVLLAAALLAAPAAAQRCPDATSRERPAERARSEAARRFADSLQVDVVAALRQAGLAEPAGLVVVDVRDRRTGEAEVHTFTEPIVGEAVRAELSARAAQLATYPGRESTFHLRLDPGPTPAPGAAECAPRLLETEQLRRDLVVLIQRESRFFSPSASREIVHVRMLVDRRGEVVFANLARRGMHPQVDRALLELAQRQRFDPATLDGVPVDVWVELPFRLGGR
jgi:TonB family protein